MFGFGEEQPAFGDEADGGEPGGEGGQPEAGQNVGKKRQDQEKQRKKKTKEDRDDAQPPGVLAGDPEAHFLHQVISAIVRRIEKCHYAFQPGGGLSGAGHRPL